MAKNNKNTKTATKKVAEKSVEIVEAPVVEEQVENTKEPVSVVTLGDLSSAAKTSQATGLDPNRQVDLLTGLRMMYHEDPNAATRYGISQDTVDKINRITAVGFVAVLANEVMFSKNAFAQRMSISQLEVLKEVAPEIGVEFDTKALPAPKDGIVEVPKEAIKVSKATQKALKQEADIIGIHTTTLNNPTCIKSEEELKTKLLGFLSQRNDLFKNIEDAITFYQSYLRFRATKEDNRDEAIANVDKLTRVELFTKITELVETCPIVVRGIGNYMLTTTSTSKNPISAFCSLRNTAKSKTTGVPTVEDDYIADIVKVLVIWAAKIKKTEQQDNIKKAEKNLEVLKKDAKNNKKAIDTQNEKIETYRNNIKHFDEVIGYVTNPSLDAADNLLTNIAEKDSTAMKTFKAITDSYYADVDIRTVKKDCLDNNVQQYAGIIINMFRDPLSTVNNYSVSNITELEMIPGTEETKETPKND